MGRRNRLEYNMKRIIIFLLLVALTLTFLTSCGNKNSDDTEQNGTENNGNEQNGTGDNITGDNGENGGDDTEEDIENLPGVDLLNADLSEYVEIEEKYYKGYTVTIDPNRISTLDVENEIIQVLCKHKSEEAVEGDGVISVGDVAHIYYKGYYMKDGEKYFFQGGDNTSSASPHKLEIGSGGFIPGFEYNLIGKNPSDYTEESPIVVETFFPENYSSAELAGKTAYFIVTVEKLEEYDAPSLDENFILETLKVSEEALSEYEGEDVVEKYRSYIYETVAMENGLDVETLTLNAFWESVLSGAVIKKYPEREVKAVYDDYEAQLKSYYEYYYSYYYEYDDFMCLYLGLEVGEDWSAYLKSMAQESIKQQLIFYHIMNIEGLKPTEEEYNNLIDEYVISAMESNGLTEDKYESKDEYITAKEEYKKKAIEQNGEDYFKSMIYYNIGSEKMMSYANIVESAE